VITVARKPLSESSVAANVLKHGTGAINIDATRVGSGEDKGVWPVTDRDCRVTYSAALTHTLTEAVETDTTKGRWPANMILQHLPGCRKTGVKRVKGTSIHGEAVATRRSGVHAEAGGHQTIGRQQPVRGYSDADGTEVIDDWVCAPGCPVADLDGQSERPGVGGTDSGGASRFFKQVGGSE
jgi:site-specific DNA-methyltransferase (adenine-specific)